MVALMILIVLLLLVIVVWMIAITALYYSLYKGLVAVKGFTETAADVQTEAINDLQSVLREINSCMKAIEDHALECYESTKVITAGAGKNKEFAMQTIRAARSVATTLKTLTKKMEKGRESFVWEEPAEDPDSPRS